MTARAMAPGGNGFGVLWGATLGLGSCVWLVAIERISGPGAFERVGLTMGELTGLYTAGFLAAGLAVDVLEGRLGAVGGILQGLVFAFSSLVLVRVNMGLSWGRPFPTSPVFLIIFTAVGGVLGGYLMWLEDRPAEAPASGNSPNLSIRPRS